MCAAEVVAVLQRANAAQDESEPKSPLDRYAHEKKCIIYNDLGALIDSCRHFICTIYHDKYGIELECMTTPARFVGRMGFGCYNQNSPSVPYVVTPDCDGYAIVHGEKLFARLK